MKTVLLSSLLLLFLLESSSSFVIAPPWVNQVNNPCSDKSWQLIYWPKTKKCYRIFEQGPCPRSQELAYNEVTKVAKCRCPKDLLYWPTTDRCYPEFSKGPCEANQYLEKDPKSSSSSSSSGGGGGAGGAAGVHCTNVKRCDNGWVFWPSLKECYELYTQGPCHKGDLLIMNPVTAEPYCGCDPLLLQQYFFPPLGLCYEHFTRGPCEAGLLFAYNHTSQSTHCMCSPVLANHHLPTQQCFQFGTKGPCTNGQTYTLDDATGLGKCSCRSHYVAWPPTGECHKSFTPGPCTGEEEFIVPDENEAAAGRSGVGKCVQNPCPKAHLYFPGGGGGGEGGEEGAVQCHKVGSRGPCQLGQLVVFEKYSGKSYRGECGCSPGYNQNYWPENGQCYEWYTRGPCPAPFLFQYSKDLGRTDCLCDEQEGFVFWNETGMCYRVYSKGPCPDNAWLIPGEATDEVFCECRGGHVFDPHSYTCVGYGGGGGDEGERKKQQTVVVAPAVVAAPAVEERPPVTWSQGVFVAPAGHTGVAKRVEVPDYGWLREGPKALPRVARRRRYHPLS